MTKDAQARRQAIDPHTSFIVQAPAGSGKTELLTQRFLNLLTQVDSPEQVVALTFTRKAASEMRERILATLNADPQSVRADTLALAQAVLARDQSLGWQLCQQPQRLRVMTLDALSQSILRMMPSAAQEVFDAEIDPYPERLYFEAAYACFSAALSDKNLQSDLTVLLRHLDNQQDRLIKLWVSLLQARDQWLNVVFLAKNQSRAKMEKTLQQIQTTLLHKLVNALPPMQQSDLHQFCLQLVQLPTAPNGSACLKKWIHFQSLTLEQAKALAKILLTSQQTLRKRADHHIGLKKDACAASLYQQLKSQSEDLFAQIGSHDTFIEDLIHLIYLPYPEYDEKQWTVLQALFSLLIQLVAHLKLVFQEKKRVDFIEISARALNALGDEETPTDLGLYFDYAIHHLLVDEFQDTSITQYYLIKRLTAGWLPEDGRTLFIVGDPMQSIYRFRQAEVGLFLKVKEEGLGALTLTSLSLTSNFRSSPQLVEWVNQHMACVFPKREDIELGAVAFHASEAQAPFSGEIAAHYAMNSLEEAQQLLILLKKELAIPDQTISILVRSRLHLESIIPVLQAENISFEGVDLFPMSEKAHLRDIYSLTQALLLPAARLPWLCVLRGPYVGLSLEDLHCVAMESEQGSIYSSLEKVLSSSRLSEEGQGRLGRAFNVFRTAMQVQDQLQLSEWILKVHLDLIGQAFTCTQRWIEFEQFFKLLDQFTEKGMMIDWILFETYFKRLYSSEASSSRIKIMTIHQSKGLEFDVVFMPGLGNMIRRSDPSLLRWTSVIQAQGEKEWLLSPLQAAQEEEHDPLYHYLGRLEEKKAYYERQRLLYVGVTRAKKRLYLLDSREKPYSGSFRDDLKTVVFQPAITNLPSQEIGSQKKRLYRLPLNTYIQPRPSLISLGNEKPQLQIETYARGLGIIAHRWIQRICQSQLTHHQDLPWSLIEKECEQAGFIGTEKNEVINTLHQQLHDLFATPRGRWLIAPHPEAKNEYAFCVSSGETYVVDRLFFTEGAYWIVDFKTGLDDEEAENHHRIQVNGYASHLKNQLNAPIRCGLYYLATNKWLEWQPQ